MARAAEKKPAPKRAPAKKAPAKKAPAKKAPTKMKVSDQLAIQLSHGWQLVTLSEPSDNVLTVLGSLHADNCGLRGRGCHRRSHSGRLGIVRSRDGLGVRCR